MSEKNQTGGCLCGNVSYSFNKEDPLSAHHCHCKDCQKSTGSGKATILLIPEDALEVEGNVKYFTVTGSAGSHISRGFCSECGSPLISFVEENASVKFIKVGSIDDSSWINVDSNFWSSTANTWSPADEQIHSFTHNPDFA